MKSDLPLKLLKEYYEEQKSSAVAEFTKVHPQEKYWRCIPIVIDTHIITDTAFNKNNLILFIYKKNSRWIGWKQPL